MTATAPFARLTEFARHLQSVGWTVQYSPVGAGSRITSRPPVLERMSIGWRVARLMRLEGDVQPSLFRAARHDVLSRPAAATLVSVPPFSGLAGAASVGSTAPLVADYRDVWMHDALVPGLSRLTSWLERRAARRLDGVTYAGTSAFGDLLVAISGLPPDRVVAVPNGIRPEDVPSDGIPERVADRALDLVFAGSVYGTHQLRHVAHAVRRLGRGRVRLEVIGPTAPDQLARSIEVSGPGIVHTPALPRTALYQRIRAADVAVIALVDSFPHELSIPVKSYEYFALGVPTLAIVPRSSAVIDLAGSSQVIRVDPGDIDGIESIIADLAEHREQLVRSPMRPEPFSRDIGLSRLDDLLERVVAG